MSLSLKDKPFQYQYQPSIKDIITTPYIKVISIIKEAKKYINMMSKSQSKLIRELDWTIKVITNHSLYTYEISDNSLLSKCLTENEDFHQFISFVSDYNEKVIEINKTSDMLLSKSAQMQTELTANYLLMPSISVKKSLLSKPRKCRSKNKTQTNKPLQAINSHMTNNITSSPSLGLKLPINSFKLMTRNSNLNGVNNSNTTSNINNTSSSSSKLTRKGIGCISKSPLLNSNNNYIKQYFSFSKFQNQNAHNNNSPSRKRFHTPTSSETKSKLQQYPFLPIEATLITSNYDTKRILSKDFNIFELKSLIGHHNVLPLVGRTILESFGINDTMINTSKLDSFLISVSNSYYISTLYHNSIHGADVTQTITLFFLNSNAESLCSTNMLDILSILIAALGHDIGHPGYTNSFQINSSSDIALTYNDVSCLENFHAARLFKLQRVPENNIFDKLSVMDYKTIRKRMIGMILATDMANHGKVMSVIKGRINASQGYNANSEITILSGDAKTKFEEQQMVLDFFIHSADLAHNTKLFDISLQWVELLSNEFWLQGDKEKSLNLPVSFLCERTNADIPNSQVGFIKGFIIPTFDVLVQMFPSLNYTVDNAKNNLYQWEQLVKENRKKGWTHRESVANGANSANASGINNKEEQTKNNSNVSKYTSVNTTSPTKKTFNANWGKPRLIIVNNNTNTNTNTANQ